MAPDGISASLTEVKLPTEDFWSPELSEDRASPAAVARVSAAEGPEPTLSGSLVILSRPVS